MAVSIGACTEAAGNVTISGELTLLGTSGVGLLFMSFATFKCAPTITYEITSGSVDLTLLVDSTVGKTSTYDAYNTNMIFYYENAEDATISVTSTATLDYLNFQLKEIMIL